MPASPHILVIRRRYLGDIALLGSFLRNLRLHWPEARIGVLTEPAYSELLALNPDITGAIALPTKLRAWPKFIRTLRRARFTHVFDLDNTDKTALITRLTGAPERHAIHLEKLRRHFPSFYTHTTFISSEKYSTSHITETYLAMLATAGVPVVTREARLVPRPSDIAAITALVGPPQTHSRKILLHPGSRSPYRVWPAENFAALCDRIQDELNAQIFLVGGPAERPLLDAIRTAAKSHLVVIDRALPIGQFAALAAQFDLMICHDSGPMHVATAVGKSVVALVGAQNITIWGPVGPHHQILQASQPCAAACVAPADCSRGDSYKNLCVRRITVTETFAAVRTALATAR